MDIIRPTELLDAMLTSSNVAETSPATSPLEWSSATAYVVDDEVSVTYTTAGASIATHLIYTCNLAHTNKDPTLTANQGYDTDGTTGLGWNITDATNRWRAFNNVIQQATTNANTIEYEITAGEQTTAIAFFGLDAQTVTVTVTDPTDGVIYNEEFSVISDSGIDDWYLYFTEEIVREQKLIVFGLPAFYAAAVIDIVIDDTGATPAVGEIVFGNQFNIGASQYGATFTITDYSVKATAEDGAITISQGAYSNLADINVVIDTPRFDHIKNTLTEIRSTPIVWVADQNSAETMLFGYYRNFRIQLGDYVTSRTLLQIEGLI
jgi:hypothetical protein